MRYIALTCECCTCIPVAVCDGCSKRLCVQCRVATWPVGDNTKDYCEECYPAAVPPAG